METMVTAKIRIQSRLEILATIKTYTKALQFCTNNAWDKKIRNNFKLHHIVYNKLRTRFKLPAQLAIACIKQACGIVKKAKSRPSIRKASVGYNFPRSARFNGHILSIRTLKKREKFALKIPLCYKKYFNKWDIKESLLRMDKKGRCFFLFTFSKKIKADISRLPKKILGIDLGINNLAVTSDAIFFGSAEVKRTKRKYKYLRSKLQAKGTRSAKRLLSKLRGRETRYMAWINHNISKQIVSNFEGHKIIIENLKGIRKRRRSKIMNFWISSWSFFQLQTFIQYKAEQKGIIVKKVESAYTSQICHKCGVLGTRSKSSFACLHCGLKNYSADLNAARNLAHPKLVERQVAITRPYSWSYDAEAVIGTEAELMAKINTLV